MEPFTVILRLSQFAEPELARRCARMNSFDLGLWIAFQRTRYRVDLLRNDRFFKLQEFIVHGQLSWASPNEKDSEVITLVAQKEKEEEELWMAWYRVLVFYGRRHGHCNVGTAETIALPDGFEAELGKWVHQQRSAIKHGRLAQRRTNLFIGLVEQNLLAETWKGVVNRPAAPPAAAAAPAVTTAVTAKKS